MAFHRQIVLPRDLHPVRLPHTCFDISGHYIPENDPPCFLGRDILPFSVRFDVDGWYPQDALSLTWHKDDSGSACHIVAKLCRTSPLAWRIAPLKTFGKNMFACRPISVRFDPESNSGHCRIMITCAVDGSRRLEIPYKRTSLRFHPLRWEYDRVEHVSCTTSYPPASHPVRPAPLDPARLSVITVFNRAGFDLSVENRHDIVPMELASQGGEWNERELHDAMQTYWSNFSDKPQWSLWTLFANAFQENHSIAGIMFDTLGRAKRRGTALFSHASLFCLPHNTGGASAAWKKRLRFVCTCHEIGHALNLSHSWEKGAFLQWVPMQSSEEAFSFMNYPSLFPGGEERFFSGFMFRFDDDELFFMRHAPDEFVEMGNATCPADIAFAAGSNKGNAPLHIELRTNRREPDFEFMEPVLLECKLKNRSDRMQLVDEEQVIRSRIRIVVQRKGSALPLAVHPFARFDGVPGTVCMAPGESRFFALFVSAGTQGWSVAEPGEYRCRAGLTHDKAMIVSNWFDFKVKRPVSRICETLAQDYFTDDVARILAFGGSNVLVSGNDCLRTCIEKNVPDPVARHASIALALPLHKDSKRIDYCGSGPDGRPRIAVRQMRSGSDAVVDKLRDTLFIDSDSTVETLGNLRFKQYADDLCSSLILRGRADEARRCLRRLHDTLAKRKVKRSVLSSIIERIDPVK